ncbi:hypothetical protein HMPREF0322_01917 [Desulfitobacterium hafniense DP7]|uniref:Uncharacterized protein n=1 Tax=Desulfitobacterium hafniense DP7 TaxID=537010 RepID=G9XLT1_DESHA|nr:hypothetical protein HMPREF0322_01917 [Desulfitobacterium hafniense DP7]
MSWDGFFYNKTLCVPVVVYEAEIENPLLANRRPEGKLFC